MPLVFLNPPPGYFPSDSASTNSIHIKFVCYDSLQFLPLFLVQKYIHLLISAQSTAMAPPRYTFDCTTITETQSPGAATLLMLIWTNIKSIPRSSSFKGADLDSFFPRRNYYADLDKLMQDLGPTSSDV